MSRNTLPYRKFVILPLLLVLLTLLAGCANVPISHTSSSPKAHASIHTFSLPFTQHLHDLANVFDVQQSASDTGIAIVPGEEVIIQNIGVASARGTDQSATSNPLSQTCPSQTLPEPALPCHTLLFSIGLFGQVNSVPSETHFTARQGGTLFLGVNTPFGATDTGTTAYEVKVITVPQGGAEGLWQYPTNNFLFRGEKTVLSMQAFSRPGLIQQVQFTATVAGKAPIPICSATKPTGTTYSCTWNLAGAGFSGDKTTLGFEIITSTHEHIVNPDGQRHGSVRSSSAAVSSNYAGYIAQQAGGSNFSSVESSWNMPTVTCSPGETSEVAFWTGLTGNQSQHNTIAQVAVIASCHSGRASYGADWELFPATAQTIAHTVQPGDTISARVAYQNGQFQLTMHDAQQGWSFSVNRPGSASNATVAECITEAPTLIQAGTQHNITDLANFGRVNMSCQADGTPIGAYPQLSQYQMIAANATASTSGLNSSGSEFSVTWQGK
ncbi:MAG TPA: G1 family glutamic endopeptidase [Ktedonobacteraceae bacterium]|jgi:hypothetical protein